MIIIRYYIILLHVNKLQVKRITTNIDLEERGVCLLAQLIQIIHRTSRCSMLCLCTRVHGAGNRIDYRR